jgi:hypothetical protein
MFWGIENASFDSQNSMRTATVDSSGTVTFVADVTGIMPASLAVTNTNWALSPASEPYPIVMAMFRTTETNSGVTSGYTYSQTNLWQNTYFFVDQNLKVIGRMAAAEADLPTNANFREVKQCVPVTGPAEDNYPLYYGQLVTTNMNSSDELKTVSTRIFELEGDVPAHSVELNGYSLLSGGHLFLYENGYIVEHGFHIRPQLLEVSGGGASSVLADGTYSFLAVYRWQDSQGRIYRSTPGDPLTVTASSASADLRLSAELLKLTEKTTANNVPILVDIEIYGTKVNGSVFYYLGDANASGVFDAFNSLVVASSLQLYTESDLDNFPSPPVRDLTTDRSRVWLVGSRGDVWFSKEYSDTDPPQFNDGFQFAYPRGEGDITGITAVSSGVIVMQPRLVSRLYGATLDNAGNGGFPTRIDLPISYGPARLGDYFATVQGIYMMTQNGLWLISYSLEPVYVGNASENTLGTLSPYDSAPPTGSEFLEMANNFKTGRIHFASEDNFQVMLEVSDQRWTTSYSTTVMANMRGFGYHLDNLAWVDSAGQVYYEDDTNARDNTTDIDMSVHTGHLRLGEMVGFHRAIRAEAQVKVKSACSVNFSVKQADGTAQTETFTLEAGDVGKVVNLDIRIANQRQPTIQLCLDEQSSSSPWTGVELVGFGISYIRKRRFSDKPSWSK